MAEEEVKKEEKPKKKGFNIKIILIGLPLFIVQLVLVYFITATFLVKTTPNTGTENKDEHVEQSADEEHAEGEEVGGPAHIYSIEDLIINPAGTNGQRLLLLSIGFGVSSEEKTALLKSNEVVIKDLILNTISQKTLNSLSKVELKDSLKTEIADQINKAIPDAKIKNVYFSKYVLN